MLLTVEARDVLVQVVPRQQLANIPSVQLMVVEEGVRNQAATKQPNQTLRTVSGMEVEKE